MRRAIPRPLISAGASRDIGVCVEHQRGARWLHHIGQDFDTIGELTLARGFEPQQHRRNIGCAKLQPMPISLQFLQNTCHILGCGRRIKSDQPYRRPRTLDGVRVMVTRAASQAEPFVRALEAVGAVVVVCPLIRIEAIEVTLPDPDVYDWILFTSVNGVDRFFELLGQRALPGRISIAAIGPETAAALADRGRPAQIVPPLFKAEELAAALPGSLVGGARILIPRAAGSRDLLPEQLRRHGARVDVLETYRAVPPADLGEKLQAAIG